MDQSPVREYYWNHSVNEVLDALGSRRHGLSAEAAAGRLRQYGRNTLAAGPGQSKALRLFLDRFRSPLVLILMFAAGVAFIVHDWLDALIVLAIVFITAVLGFIQEYRATRAVDKLRQRGVRLKIITALQKTGHVVGYLGDGINFMITFGLVSTVFDLLTFAVLLYFAGEAAAVFRTGWFVESLLTELLILFVIRTRKPFHQSKAGQFLVWSTAGIVLLTLVLPYLPLGRVFDFVPLPVPVLIAILLVTGLYVVASEFTKRAFFRRFDKQ